MQGASVAHVRVQLVDPWAIVPKGPARAAPKKGAKSGAKGGAKKGSYKAKFSVLHHEAAAARQPPNKFDLSLYVSEPGTIALETDIKVCLN